MYVSGSLLICPLLSSLCLGVSVSQRPFVAALCERHGHPGWRVLGSFLSVRRPQRQDPGSHWLRGLPQTGGTAAVSIYQKEGWASSRQWGSRKEWGHRGVEMSKGSRAGRREMDERRRKQKVQRGWLPRQTRNIVLILWEIWVLTLHHRVMLQCYYF